MSLQKDTFHIGYTFAKQKTAHAFVAWAAVFVIAATGYDGNIKAWLFVMYINSS